MKNKVDKPRSAVTTNVFDPKKYFPSKPESICAVPSYLSTELEKLQKRAMRIMFPFMPYKVVLATAGLPSMYERRETITAKLFNVISNPDHKLHSLLPTRNQSKYSLRNNRAYHLSGAKTNRLKNTFIYSKCR